jgi:hypothetical protein
MALLAASLFACNFAMEFTALAQRSPSSVQRRVDQLNKQGEQFERDNPDRVVKGDANKDARQRSLAQVRKDLEGLQASYNRIVLAMAANKSVDEPQVVKEVVEINECSTRLKHNLALPQPKDDEKDKPAVAVSQPAEPSLISLRKYIYSFVMNPIFESPAVLNIEEAGKASRDLDKIIELSQSISKHHVTKKNAP